MHYINFTLSLSAGLMVFYMIKHIENVACEHTNTTSPVLTYNVTNNGVNMSISLYTNQHLSMVLSVWHFLCSVSVWLVEILYGFFYMTLCGSTSLVTEEIFSRYFKSPRLISCSGVGACCLIVLLAAGLEFFSDVLRSAAVVGMMMMAELVQGQASVAQPGMKADGFADALHRARQVMQLTERNLFEIA